MPYLHPPTPPAGRKAGIYKWRSPDGTFDWSGEIRARPEPMTFASIETASQGRFFIA